MKMGSLATAFRIISAYCIATRFQSVDAQQVHPVGHIHRGLNEESIHCIVYELSVESSDDEVGKERCLSCSTLNHGPSVLLEGDFDNFFNKKLVSGSTSIRIPTYLISSDFVVDLNYPGAKDLITITSEHSEDNPPKTTRKFEHEGWRHNSMKGRRFLENYDGFFKVLVVRITDLGTTPTFNIAEISNQVFSNQVSMAKQYRDCSNNILKIAKADGGPDITEGVIDIEVEVDLSETFNSLICVNSADDVLTDLDIGDTHDFTMYICPDSVDFTQNPAVSQLGGARSWYSNEFGSYPFVGMHMIGHNLFLFESLESGLTTGDPSCVMGRGFDREDRTFGKMCFNAAKTFNTGWYSDYHRMVNPVKGYRVVDLVDINAVRNGEIRGDQYLIVKVPGVAGEAVLYFMLHRLEGLTKDMLPEFVDTHANRVNVIRQTFVGGTSFSEAQLGSGELYTRDNWSGTGKQLRIEVCSIADTSADGGAKVLVYMEGDDVNCSSSNPPTSTPTSTPTNQPSGIPSQSPVAKCVDSPLKMFFKDGFFRTCSWVTKADEATRDKRCENEPGLASHCPSACGTCIVCSDSGKRFKTVENKKDIKSCAWVKRKNLKMRCKKEGVTQTCKKTCGICDA